MTSSALINPAPPEDEKEMVAAVFKDIGEQFGFVPDGLILYGISPPLLKAFIDNFSYFITHEKLSQKLFGLIRYLNSSSVSCPYCIDFNTGFLMNLGVSQEQLKATRENLQQAPLNESEKVLLEIAMAALENPEGVTSDVLQRAGDLGLTDRDIFDAVAQAVSNRAFTSVLKTFDVIRQGASFNQ
ncbi:MAG: hypothetical protein ABFS39_08220 [Pseudomonadota bacterium]